jgi:hypothetical protein
MHFSSQLYPEKQKAGGPVTAYFTQQSFTDIIKLKKNREEGSI